MEWIANEINNSKIIKEMITCQNFLFSILAKLREYCCEQNEFITQMLDFLEHTVAIYFQAITSLVPYGSQ